MKILLDIKDDKAAFIMELLNNFKFVKAKPLLFSLFFPLYSGVRLASPSRAKGFVIRY